VNEEVTQTTAMHQAIQLIAQALGSVAPQVQQQVMQILQQGQTQPMQPNAGPPQQ